ncbi:MAG: hypothetical protein IJK66_03070 [Bacilli bacterium]|nr:hypothetical protein [Bacilli bacterium]
MKTIVKYRVYIIIAILLIFFAFVFVTMKAYLKPNDESVVCGSLAGIEKVPMNSTRKNEIIKSLKEDESIDEVKVQDIKCKTINIIIKTNSKDNTIDKMKEKGNELLKNFSKEESSFYDIQLFIKNEENNFVMIGYKNSSNDDVTWTSDELVKSEVEVDEKEQ